MRTPKEIVNESDDNVKTILSRILEIEKEYQNITELSKQRDKEISDKIINVIERGIK